MGACGGGREGGRRTSGRGGEEEEEEGRGVKAEQYPAGVLGAAPAPPRGAVRWAGARRGSAGLRAGERAGQEVCSSPSQLYTDRAEGTAAGTLPTHSGTLPPPSAHPEGSPGSAPPGPQTPPPQCGTGPAPPGPRRGAKPGRW